jgi:hypothetical protein
MSSKHLKWWTNIHAAKEHEVRGDWEGGGLLCSWFINTNHKKKS